MIDAFVYAIAGGDYYAPLESIADPGPRFTPSPSAPAGWRPVANGIWQVWQCPGELPEQGWKIHVSARPSRPQAVLDTVAELCFAERVPFKHVAAERFFLFLHHKHGPRAQSGKFCAIYPPDQETAEKLMIWLADALATEEGPYILTDRRFRDSRTVHYRYGAFTGRGRVRPDGTAELLVRDAEGRDLPDVRGVSFTLPPGVTDPFAPPPEPDVFPVVVGGYEVVRVLQHSNAGGAYEAVDRRTGRRVFIKEARAHNGLTWDGTSAQDRLRNERDTLTVVHREAPGVGPEPLDYFREWEHEFLVTEFIDGGPLFRWSARNAPLIQAGRGRADFARYYAECVELLDGLADVVTRLHDLGYVFGDLTPRNIMITESGRVRLIDFETAYRAGEPPTDMATPGYVPPAGLESASPYFTDQYAQAAVALSLLFPLHPVLERSPGNVHLMRHGLFKKAPVPDVLWRRATLFTAGPADAALPTPRDLDTAPRESLTRLADGIARTLLAEADPARPEWIFPPGPRGFQTNHLCVAHGTAGVVHALHHAGMDVPAEIVRRLRDETMKQRADLPPGLHAGTAGIAWALAEQGLTDEATDLLRDAVRHPIRYRSSALGDGAAGIGTAALALHRLTGATRYLDDAAWIGDTLGGAVALAPNRPRGLADGLAGIALFLHRLADVTGTERYRDRGRELLREELAHGVDLPDGALSFADDDTAARAMPYLMVGSAGVGMALNRYSGEEEFAAPLARVVRDATKPFTVESGLFRGLAGLVLFLADNGSPDTVPMATELTKYAIPGGDGFRFLSEGCHRYGADLASGASGVLLALARVLNGPAGQFMTH